MRSDGANGEAGGGRVWDWSLVLLAVLLALLQLLLASGLVSAGLQRGLLAVLLVEAVAWGLGLWLLRRFEWTPRPCGLAEHGFALLAGQGLLGLLGLILGLLQLYRGWILVSVLALLVPLAWSGVRSAGLSRPEHSAPLAGWGRALAWVAGGVTLLAALPPCSWLDSLEYHGALPALYLLEGGMVELGHNMFSHLPHLPQLSFGFVLAVDWQAPLGVIGWLWSLSLVAGVAALAERLAGGSRWLAVALVASAPVLLRSSFEPGVDQYLAAVTVHGLVQLLQHDAQAGLASVLLAGGLAAASKLHGALSCAALVAAWLALHGPRSVLPALRRPAVLLAATALLLPAPFALRSWLNHGSPVWPFLDPGGANREWVEAVVDYTRLAGLDDGHAARLPLELLRFLWQRDGWHLGVLPGLLATLALGVWRRPRLRPLWAFALVFTLGWTLGATVPRYALGLLGVLAAVSATGALELQARLRQPGWARLWAAALLLPCLLALSGAAIDIEAGRDFMPYVSGGETRGSYLARAVPMSAQRVLLRASQELPPEAFVISFDDPRLMHFERRWRASTAFDPPLLRSMLATGPGAPVERLRRSLVEGGFTHVLVNQRYALWLAGEFPALLSRSPEEQRALVELLETHARLLYAADEGALFELLP